MKNEKKTVGYTKEEHERYLTDKLNKDGYIYYSDLVNIDNVRPDYFDLSSERGRDRLKEIEDKFNEKYSEELKRTGYFTREMYKDLREMLGMPVMEAWWDDVKFVSPGEEPAAKTTTSDINVDGPMYQYIEAINKEEC